MHAARRHVEEIVVGSSELLVVGVNVAVIGVLGVGLFYVIRGAILSAERKKRQ